MKIVFIGKHDHKRYEHEGVRYMAADNEILGLKGWYLGFEDGTFCLVQKASFNLVSVEA